MPSSRSTSPAGSVKDSKAMQSTPQEEGAAALLSTLPALNVPIRSVHTRSSSPQLHERESEGLLRVQEHTLGMISDLGDHLEEDAQTLTVTGLDILLNELDRLHLQFQQNHSTLLEHWSPSLATHRYFTDHSVKKESKLVFQTQQRVASMKERLNTAAQPAQIKDHSQIDKLLATSRLPDLSLPKFGGKHSEWPHFRVMFQAVIGKHEHLEDSEKLQYLRSSLYGPAADIVNHLPPANESYSAALDLLAARYQNKRLILEAKIETLLALSPMQERSAKEIETMLNSINDYSELVRQLQSTQKFDNLLVYQMSKLLDQESLNSWHKRISHSHEFPTVAEFTEFLSDTLSIVESVERVKKVLAINNPPKPTLRTTPSNTQGHSSAKRTTLAVTTRSQYPCDNCQGDHFLAFCQDFRRQTTALRLQLVKEAALCVNCLGHHNVRNCRSKMYCSICDDRHHSLLHGENLSGLFAAGRDHSTTAHSKNTPTTSKR